MIEIGQRSPAPASLPSDEASAPVDPANAPNDERQAPSSVAAAVGDTDPVTKLNALFGASPSMQRFQADKNGAGAGRGTKAAAGATSTPAPKTPAAPKPSAVFDIAGTTDAQIEQLRKNGQKQLANTIENAQAAYRDFLESNPGVKILVTTSAGNGGHPVLIVAGPKAKEGAHVHTHYHGDNATVADPLGSKAGQNARIRATIKEDPHAVFVLPEAANSTAEPDSPVNDNHYRAQWSDVRSQVGTTQDALDAAGVKDVRERVVSFHSGGGMALVHLMRADPKGNLLRADRVELYDCIYHFDSGVKGSPYVFEKYMSDWGRTANGKAVDRVIFYRGTNGDHERKAATIKDAFPDQNGKARFTMIDVSKRPALVDEKGNITNDRLDPIAVDARGNWFEVVSTDRDGRKVETGKPAHNYNPNAHYRTTGEFLGTRPRP